MAGASSHKKKKQVHTCCFWGVYARIIPDFVLQKMCAWTYLQWTFSFVMTAAVYSIEGYAWHNMISDVHMSGDSKHEHVHHLCGVYGYARTIHDFLCHCFCFWLCFVFVLFVFFLVACFLVFLSSLVWCIFCLFFLYLILFSFFLTFCLLYRKRLSVLCPSLLCKPKWLTPYAWTYSLRFRPPRHPSCTAWKHFAICTVTTDVMCPSDHVSSAKEVVYKLLPNLCIKLYTGYCERSFVNDESMYSAVEFTKADMREWAVNHTQLNCLFHLLLLLLLVYVRRLLENTSSVSFVLLRSNTRALTIVVTLLL